MPVWWGTIAYSLIVSFIGMYMYKSKKASATLVPAEEGKSEQYKSIGIVMALLSFALLVFFVGNRSGIHDSQEYQYMYDLFFTDDLNQITEIINGTRETKGPLFFIYLVLFKHFTHGTYNDWFMSMALIQCVSIAVFLYKYSINYTYSVFLFYMTGGAIWLVNGIRQFFAVTLILFFSDWIIKRKTIPFFIVVFFAYYIHSASLLWIPIYFIVAFKPWSSKFIISVVAFVIGMILLSRSSLLGSTDFSYLSTESYEGINPFRIAVFSVPAVIAFVRRDEIKRQKNVFLDLLVNFSVVCSACYIVGWFSNGIIARIAMYFTPFIYVLLPLVLKKTFDEGMGKTIFIISVVGFLAYFCFEMYIAKNGVYYSEILGLNFWNL